jgi:hypothetical protein
MPKTNEQLYEESVADLYGTAIRQTEQEIYDDALGLAPDENNYDHELELSEGIDGEPISDVELAAAAAGAPGTEHGYDRPLQLNEDISLMDENRLLREELADHNALLNEIQNGPAAREAARERFKEGLYQNFGLMGLDDGRIDALHNVLAGAHAQVSHVDSQTDRVNRSLHAVRDEYGDEEFNEAYQALVRAGQSGDTHTVNQIYHSANPGRALMNWRDGGGVNPDLGLAGARNVAPRANRRMPGRDEIDRMRSGFGDADVERDIADSVWS